MGITLPRLAGLQPRHCFRNDEQPAATFAMSMLRLDLARTTDWTGSPVDFVAKGFARYCQANGIAKVSRIFEESNLQLLDEIMELSDYERNQQGRDVSSTHMFLLVNYEQSAMIQMGPVLRILEGIDVRLPAAFFLVVAHNLGRWMRIYDFRDAELLAEDALVMMEEEEVKESFYPQVKQKRPACLNELPEYGKAIRFLRHALPRVSDAILRDMIRLCLEMHEQGDGFELAYPSALQDVVPGMEDYLENTDHPGPGALLVDEENDLVEACFTEEMQYLGQNLPISSSAMLAVDLTQSIETLDRQVKRVFDYVGAMLRSLSPAAELILKIRRIYDEDLRQRRMESRVQAKPGATDLR